MTSPEVGASNERVLREFWSNRDSIGNLPYLRSELLALRWARSLSRVGKSLEQHLQQLDTRAEPVPSGSADNPEFFATTRLRSALKTDLGNAVNSDLDKYIERGETIPINGQFLGPCFDGIFHQRAMFELGFDSKSSFANRRISGVAAGSAAERAGLHDGVLMKSWSGHTGDSTREVSVTVIENNEPRVIKFLPSSSKTIRVPVFTAKADASTNVACAAWLPKLR